MKKEGKGWFYLNFIGVIFFLYLAGINDSLDIAVFLAVGCAFMGGFTAALSVK